MKELNCQRCGQPLPEGYSQCPLCGAAVTQQPQAGLNAAQKRYVVWFVLLTIFCLTVAFWAPR